jgi:hypothetical protein
MSADSAHKFKPGQAKKAPHGKGHNHETPTMKGPMKYEKPSKNKTRS